MGKHKKSLPSNLQPWVDARKRFQLSHAQVQMARELGLNPRKFGGMANHKQERWKIPLPQYIEELYLKRFHKAQPDNVRSIEQIAHDAQQKKAERKARRKQQRKSQHGGETESRPPADVPEATPE